MSSELQFKVGDRVRTIEAKRDRGVLYDGEILELDAVNGTAIVKGAMGPADRQGGQQPIPISLSDLELVPESDPTVRYPSTSASIPAIGQAPA